MPQTENRLAPELAERLFSLLNRFRQFRREPEQQLSEAHLHAQAKIADFLDRFRKARTGPDGLDAKQAKWEAKNAPHFNVFRVVGLQRRETKLHSPILAEFLNPSGIHGQGTEFLKAFLTMIKKTGLNDLGGLLESTEFPKSSDWEIIADRKFKESGRPDIRLNCRRCGFQMVIENKVDAPEGPYQLRRYFKDLEKEEEYPKCFLVFLTPTGRLPKTEDPAKCICISYQEHIVQWLEEVKGSLEAPWLRTTVEQYLEIVNDL
jgi:hypothetical protein